MDSIINVTLLDYMENIELIDFKNNRFFFFVLEPWNVAA